MSDKSPSPAVAVAEPAAAVRAPVAEVTPSSGGTSALISKYGLLGAFLLTILFFSLARSDTFPTWRNAESILTVAAPPLILAVGLTVVLVMQDFDLSIGAMIGLASGAAMLFMVKEGITWQLAVLAVLGIGVLAGLANGYMVAYLGGSSFIITLAMGTVLTGVEFGLTSQETVYSGFPAGFLELARNEFLGLSYQLWIALVIAVVVWALLDRSEIGRYMYAIGGN